MRYECGNCTFKTDEWDVAMEHDCGEHAAVPPSASKDSDLIDAPVDLQQALERALKALESIASNLTTIREQYMRRYGR